MNAAHCDRPVSIYVVLHTGLANIVWANLSKKQLSPKELRKKKDSLYTLPNSKLNMGYIGNSFIRNCRHIWARPATVDFSPATAWHSPGAPTMGTGRKESSCACL